MTPEEVDAARKIEDDLKVLRTKEQIISALQSLPSEGPYESSEIVRLAISEAINAVKSSSEYPSWSWSADLKSRLAEVEKGSKAATQSNVAAISSLKYTKASSKGELKQALDQFQNALNGAKYFELAIPDERLEALRL